jgi:ABC-type dipeptide/oligopeptide/nickel transport system permease component
LAIRALPAASARDLSGGSWSGTPSRYSYVGAVLRSCDDENAAAPLALVGLQVGLLFSNHLIVESIFAWPGLGLYTVQALGSSDLPAVLGVAIAFGALYILINAVIDILQTVIDPRVGLA